MVTSALKFKVEKRHSNSSIRVSLYIDVLNCDCGSDSHTFGVLVSG